MSCCWRCCLAQGDGIAVEVATAAHTTALQEFTQASQLLGGPNTACAKLKKFLYQRAFDNSGPPGGVELPSARVPIFFICHCLFEGGCRETVGSTALDASGHARDSRKAGLARGPGPRKRAWRGDRVRENRKKKKKLQPRGARIAPRKRAWRGDRVREKQAITAKGRARSSKKTCLAR